MQRVLFVLTNHADFAHTGVKTGWYLSEVTHVLFPLLDAGYVVEFASPEGGLAPIDPQSIKRDDPLNRRFQDHPSLMRQVGATHKLSSLDQEDYGVIYFPGGWGTMFDFPGSESIADATARIYERGGVVAAICHGPSALLNVKLQDGSYLVSGKRLCSITNAEERAAGIDETMPFLLETELAGRGAIFETAEVWTEHVVTDGRLVTGQNAYSGHAMANALLKLLAGSFDEHRRTPVPPFTREDAIRKVRLAEDAWNSRDPERVVLAYSQDSRWRDRAEFIAGRPQIVDFLRRKWIREREYWLCKELWAFTDNRIAVRFAYEWHDESGQWYRSYGNENWEFEHLGLMRTRIASINDMPIEEEDRKFRWPAGSRLDGYAGLSELEL